MAQDNDTPFGRDTHFGRSVMLSRGTEHVETFQNDQTLAMSLKHGKYFAMKGTAQRIWELLETPRSERDLLDQIAREYRIPAGQCAREVLPFLAELRQFGLIVEGPA
ncbi:MAG: PqqD family protein [Pseudomonadota bacterium]